MGNKINNWIEQGRFFGLDYSTAKATIGDYTFDIRYDCDGVYDRRERRFRNDIKPICGVCINVNYKKRQFYSAFAKDIEQAKTLCESWLRSEVLNYYRKHCTMYNESELKTNPEVGK